MYSYCATADAFIGYEGPFGMVRAGDIFYPSHFPTRMEDSLGVAALGPAANRTSHMRSPTPMELASGSEESRVSSSSSHHSLESSSQHPLATRIGFPLTRDNSQDRREAMSAQMRYEKGSALSHSRKRKTRIDGTLSQDQDRKEEEGVRRGYGIQESSVRGKDNSAI